MTYHLPAEDPLDCEDPRLQHSGEAVTVEVATGLFSFLSATGFYNNAIVAGVLCGSMAGVAASIAFTARRDYSYARL